jgi:hypothetical protein
MISSNHSLARTVLTLLVTAVVFIISSAWFHAGVLAWKPLLWEATILSAIILAIWCRPLLKARYFSLAIITILFGFAALGATKGSEKFDALGPGSVFVFGLLAIIYKLSGRHGDSAVSQGWFESGLAYLLRKAEPNSLRFEMLSRVKEFLRRVAHP